jgi:hypothetical protein
VLQRFSAPVSGWDMRFSPHALHNSMLAAARCRCESMYRILFSPQEPMSSNKQHKRFFVNDLWMLEYGLLKKAQTLTK